RRQAVARQHGPAGPGGGPGAGAGARRAAGPAALRRSAAPGPGPHGHRDRLCHDGPVPCGAAGIARPDRHRPRGRRRRPGQAGDAMSALAEFAGRFMPHLMLAPIALPLLTATLTLLMREERQRIKLGLNMASTALGLLLAVALLAWTHQADTL